MGTQFFSSGKRSVDYVIVLGTQVKGETLSRSLEYRMETAVRYAKIHPNTVFILSGGKGKGEDGSRKPPRWMRASVCFVIRTIRGWLLR